MARRRPCSWPSPSPNRVRRIGRGVDRTVDRTEASLPPGLFLRRCAEEGPTELGSSIAVVPSCLVALNGRRGPRGRQSNLVIELRLPEKTWRLGEPLGDVVGDQQDLFEAGHAALWVAYEEFRREHLPYMARSSTAHQSENSWPFAWAGMTGPTTPAPTPCPYSSTQSPRYSSRPRRSDPWTPVIRRHRDRVDRTGSPRSLVRLPPAAMAMD